MSRPHSPRPQPLAQHWPRPRRWVVLCLAALLLAAPAVRAAITPEQRSQIGQVQTAATRAQNLYRQGDLHGAAEAARDAQTRFEALWAEGDDQLHTQLAERYETLKQIHALLEIEGVRLDPLEEPAGLAGPATPGTPAAGGVSFVGQVAPILVAKCGRCHVTGSRGDFQMANYAMLMRGSEAGVVVQPGSPEGSTLIRLIEEGDMPRGNLTITAQELQLLRQWITEGARFDGTDPNAGLGELSANVPTPAAAAPAEELVAAPPSGNETISFSSQLAGVLADQCLDCHSEARARANLGLATFEGLLKGGDTGPAIQPGSAASSLLIARLEGDDEGQQMPLNRDPLPAETIALFKTWINEGAVFDGADPAQNVAALAAQSAVATASHDELSAMRRETALANLQLSLPGQPIAEETTESFLLIGNVPESELADLASTAQSVDREVRELLGAPANGPLLKGRVTLYVLPQRYDYSEFGSMVEQRRLPPQWRGHWHYDGVNAYGALVPQGTAADNVQLARIFAGVYTASLGAIPTWFSTGVDHHAAARLYPDNNTVTAWDEQLPAVVAKINTPTKIFDGSLPPDEAELAAFGFVRELASDPRRFDALLTSLRQGVPFDSGFSTVHRGATPENLAGQWLTRGGR